MIPSISENVHPIPVPEHVKNRNLDHAIAAGAAAPSLREESGPLTLLLPTDLKVREVLENGGFSFVGTQDKAEIWEFERLSRDGQALKGKEAKHPPRYRITVWGAVTLRCSCPARPASSSPCKHQSALGWWLGLPVQAAPGKEQLT